MAITPEELKLSLRGIIGFGVTPFHDDLSINQEALEKNARYLAEFCDVVVPLGNNGEIHSLSQAEQKEVGRIVVREVQGRRPVIVGVGHSLPAAIDLAIAAEAYGADGILALPPLYTHTMDEGLFRYYEGIASATKLGVVLFQTSELSFSLPLLQRLAEIPNIVGMKDECGNMRHFVHQLRVVGDRLALLCGVGEILAASYFALGVRAFTSGIVNFMPQTPRRIFKSLQEGRFEEAARTTEAEVLTIFSLRAKRPGYTTAVIKEAMNLCGMDAGPVRPPLAPLLEHDRAELRSILEGLGVLKMDLVSP